MKYLDYNIVGLEFTQASADSTVFETKSYAKTEFDGILTRLKKSNIMTALVKFVNGNSSYRAALISEYDGQGYPLYSFTEDGVTFRLGTANEDGEHFHFYFAIK